MTQPTDSTETSDPPAPTGETSDRAAPTGETSDLAAPTGETSDPPAPTGETPDPATKTIRRGPSTRSERALAPDLARGAMLLLIALANTPWYLWGRSHALTTSAHPSGGSPLDQVTQFLITTTVDMRTYPMFAFLFGYGMVQLYRRQREAGTDERTVRRILRRRNWWLIAFGFAHAALLWMGDVLGAYGIAGLILVALFLRRRDRTLLVWSGVFLGLLTLAAAGSVIAAWWMVQNPYDMSAVPGGEFAAGGFAAESYLMSILQRLMMWPLLTLGQGIFGLVVPMMILLAFWAARRRILEEPWNHRRLLRRTVVVGLGVGWLGGLPQGLAQIGVIALPPHASWAFAGLHPLTGLFAGLGYVALFGLVADRLRDRPASVEGLPVRALRAVGERSLSCYLAQSLICAPLFCAWGLGWGRELGSFTMALAAIGVWLITVVGALALADRGRRGPAEVALRQLSY